MVIDGHCGWRLYLEVDTYRVSRERPNFNSLFLLRDYSGDYGLISMIILLFDLYQTIFTYFR